MEFHILATPYTEIVMLYLHLLVDRTYTISVIAIKLEISEYDWTLMEEIITVLKPL